MHPSFYHDEVCAECGEPTKRPKPHDGFSYPVLSAHRKSPLCPGCYAELRADAEFEASIERNSVVGGDHGDQR